MERTRPDSENVDALLSGPRTAKRRHHPPFRQPRLRSSKSPFPDIKGTDFVFNSGFSGFSKCKKRLDTTIAETGKKRIYPMSRHGPCMTCAGPARRDCSALASAWK